MVSPRLKRGEVAPAGRLPHRDRSPGVEGRPSPRPAHSHCVSMYMRCLPAAVYQAAFRCRLLRSASCARAGATRSRASSTHLRM